ncbi:MAG: alginate O-acetyltransferase AlgX-related protein [Candidatus Korobacteraceae bacterium]
MNVLQSRSFQRFLLVVASVLFVLFCIELPALIGIFDYRTVIGPYHMWWAPNISDPELLAIHRPHAHQSGSAMGGDIASSYQIPHSDLTRFQWDVTYDRNGFRNQRDLERADIVVIGDSFVEGLTVTDTELGTSQLAMLQRAVVANLGQSTYGPLQELIVLKRYALPLRPRTVVWMFFEGNDLQDVIAYHKAREHPPDFLHAFWARSFTRSASLAVKRLLEPQVKPPGTQRAGLCPTPEGKQLDTYFGYRAKPLTQEERNALDETAQTLATAYQSCAAQGARLIFVFVPTKFRVMHDLCQFSENSECRNWTRSDMPERLMSALHSISPDIGYLDLTPYLVEAAKTGALPYYRDDEHWTPAGHKVAAETISHYLQSSQEISRRDQVQ